MQNDSLHIQGHLLLRCIWTLKNLEKHTQNTSSAGMTGCLGIDGLRPVDTYSMVFVVKVFTWVVTFPLPIEVQGAYIEVLTLSHFF